MADPTDEPWLRASAHDVRRAADDLHRWVANPLALAHVTPEALVDALRLVLAFEGRGVVDALHHQLMACARRLRGDGVTDDQRLAGALALDRYAHARRDERVMQLEARWPSTDAPPRGDEATVAADHAALLVRMLNRGAFDNNTKNARGPKL